MKTDNSEKQLPNTVSNVVSLLVIGFVIYTIVTVFVPAFVSTFSSNSITSTQTEDEDIKTLNTNEGVFKQKPNSDIFYNYKETSSKFVTVDVLVQKNSKYFIGYRLILGCEASTKFVEHAQLEIVSDGSQNTYRQPDNIEFHSYGGLISTNTHNFLCKI